MTRTQQGHNCSPPTTRSRQRAMESIANRRDSVMKAMATIQRAFLVKSGVLAAIDVDDMAPTPSPTPVPTCTSCVDKWVDSNLMPSIEISRLLACTKAGCTQPFVQRRALEIFLFFSGIYFFYMPLITHRLRVERDAGEFDWGQGPLRSSIDVSHRSSSPFFMSQVFFVSRKSLAFIV